MDEQGVIVDDGRAAGGAEAGEGDVEAMGGMASSPSPCPRGRGHGTQAGGGDVGDVERAMGELRVRYEEARRALEETRGQLDAAERGRRIDQMLVESEAVDLEAARLLTEAAVARMDEADVERAVSELRRSKPYLFRRSGGAIRGGAMSPRPRGGPGREMDDAAEAAAVSGDRRDLLRYLRMRRS